MPPASDHNHHEDSPSPGREEEVSMDGASGGHDGGDDGAVTRAEAGCSEAGCGEARSRQGSVDQGRLLSKEAATDGLTFAAGKKTAEDASGCDVEPLNCLSTNHASNRDGHTFCRDKKTCYSRGICGESGLRGDELMKITLRDHCISGRDDLKTAGTMSLISQPQSKLSGNIDLDHAKPSLCGPLCTTGENGMSDGHQLTSLTTNHAHSFGDYNVPKSLASNDSSQASSGCIQKIKLDNPNVYMYPVGVKRSASESSLSPPPLRLSSPLPHGSPSLPYGVTSSRHSTCSGQSQLGGNTCGDALYRNLDTSPTARVNSDVYNKGSTCKQDPHTESSCSSRPLLMNNMAIPRNAGVVLTPSYSSLEIRESARGGVDRGKLLPDFASIGHVIYGHTRETSSREDCDGVSSEIEHLLQQQRQQQIKQWNIAEHIPIHSPQASDKLASNYNGNDVHGDEHTQAAEVIGASVSDVDHHKYRPKHKRVCSLEDKSECSTNSDSTSSSSSRISGSTFFTTITTSSTGIAAIDDKAKYLDYSTAIDNRLQPLPIGGDNHQSQSGRDNIPASVSTPLTPFSASFTSPLTITSHSSSSLYQTSNGCIHGSGGGGVVDFTRATAAASSTNSMVAAIEPRCLDIESTSSLRCHSCGDEAESTAGTAGTVVEEDTDTQAHSVVNAITPGSEEEHAADVPSADQLSNGYILYYLIYFILSK